MDKVPSPLPDVRQWLAWDRDQVKEAWRWRRPFRWEGVVYRESVQRQLVNPVVLDWETARLEYDGTWPVLTEDGVTTGAVMEAMWGDRKRRQLWARLWVMMPGDWFVAVEGEGVVELKWARHWRLQRLWLCEWSAGAARIGGSERIRVR